LTDFVCLLIYEFWLSLWKIALCSVILLLPLFIKRLLLYILSKNMPSNFICIVINNKHRHPLQNPYAPHYTTVMSLMNKPSCRQFTDCLYNEVSKEMSL